MVCCKRICSFLTTEVLCLSALLPFFFFSRFVKKHMMEFMEEGYAEYRQKKDFLRNDEGEWEGIVLGGSSASDLFVPKMISAKFYNLALHGSTPVEAYYVAEEYLSRHKKPNVVFLSFNDSELECGGHFWDKTMRFNFLSVRQAADFFKQTGKLSSGGYNMENWMEKWISVALPSPFEYFSQIGKTVERSAANFTEYNELVKNRGWNPPSFSFQKNIAESSDFFYACEANEFYLRKLLELLSERQIKTVFVDDSFEKGGRTSFYNALSEVFPTVVFDDETLRDDLGYDDGALKRAVTFSKKLREKHFECFSTLSTEDETENKPFDSQKAVKKYLEDFLKFL